VRPKGRHFSKTQQGGNPENHLKTSRVEMQKFSKHTVYANLIDLYSKKIYLLGKPIKVHESPISIIQ